MTCPECKQDRAHRAHRSGLKEWLAGIWGRSPYRCRGCGHRFSVPRYAVENEANLGKTDRNIVQIRRMVSRKRGRREILLYGGAALTFVMFLYYLT